MLYVRCLYVRSLDVRCLYVRCLPSGRGAGHMGGDGVSVEWRDHGGPHLGGRVNAPGKTETGAGGETEEPGAEEEGEGRHEARGTGRHCRETVMMTAAWVKVKLS